MIETTSNHGETTSMETEEIMEFSLETSTG